MKLARSSARGPARRSSRRSTSDSSEQAAGIGLQQEGVDRDIVAQPARFDTGFHQAERQGFQVVRGFREIGVPERELELTADAQRADCALPTRGRPGRSHPDARRMRSKARRPAGMPAIKLRTASAFSSGAKSLRPGVFGRPHFLQVRKEFEFLIQEPSAFRSQAPAPEGLRAQTESARRSGLSRAEGSSRYARDCSAGSRAPCAS